MDSTKATMESIVERLQRLHPLPRGIRTATASIACRPHGPPQLAQEQLSDLLGEALPWGDLLRPPSPPTTYVTTATLHLRPIPEEAEEQGKPQADPAVSTEQPKEDTPEVGAEPLQPQPLKTKVRPLRVRDQTIDKMLFNEDVWSNLGRGRVHDRRKIVGIVKPGPEPGPVLPPATIPTPVKVAAPARGRSPTPQPTAESIKERMERVRIEHRPTTMEEAESRIRRAIAADITHQPVQKAGLNIQAHTMHGTTVSVQMPPTPNTATHTRPAQSRREVATVRPQQRGTAKRRGKVGRRGAEVEAVEERISRTLPGNHTSQPVQRVGLNIQAQNMFGTSVTIEARPTRGGISTAPPRRGNSTAPNNNRAAQNPGRREANAIPMRQRGTPKRRGKPGRRGAEVEEGCWRCHKIGHCHSECLEPQKWQYCYRCGRPYYTVETCPECSGTRYGRY
ncbi:uncharacterized protein LOC143210543 [Lasioglossum baleicum]|uniref:uncharacterized protein LOC143210543 n=1 Tax=Lasioglossum baleicum TaxID=434251 RepID=UPI003FCCC625